MDNKPFESTEDFVFRCREDGMDNFIAFAGCEDGHKRACVGEGEEKDACLAMALCMHDSDEIYTLVTNAFRIATELRRDARKDTPALCTENLSQFVEERKQIMIEEGE